MGFALAAAAAKAGAQVVLISGPSCCPTPVNVTRINVTSAAEMLQSCLVHAQHCDIFIGAAAVADYTPEQPLAHKIKKDKAPLTLALVPTQDILRQVQKICQPPFMVGFAAETQNMIEHANSKRQDKQLDLIIANDVSRQDIGFNHDNNQVTLINEQTTTAWPLMSKIQLAQQLIAAINELAQKKLQQRKLA